MCAGTYYFYNSSFIFVLFIVGIIGCDVSVIDINRYNFHYYDFSLFISSVVFLRNHLFKKTVHGWK
jgi:hypothetical protein